MYKKNQKELVRERKGEWKLFWSEKQLEKIFSWKAIYNVTRHTKQTTNTEVKRSSYFVKENKKEKLLWKAKQHKPLTVKRWDWNNIQ